MRQATGKIIRLLAWPALTVLVLGGLAYGLASRRMPDDVAAVDRQIRQRAYAMPLLVGGWYGHDVKVPVQAIRELKPNVLISRRYENLRTGRSLNFLFVHCRDARNMENHYPANCYPASGWHREWKKARTWAVGGMNVPLMEYGFRIGSLGRIQRITVTDFMILPSGRFARDMEPIHELSGDPFARFYGAAQIQLVFDAATPLDRRRAAFKTFVKANQKVIRKIIQVGEKHE